jgi:hypothetical protein
MQFELAPLFERDNEGLLKRINGGHYRFSLALIDSETREVKATFYGWRITPDGQYVLPPQSTTVRGGIFTMGSISADLINGIIAAFRNAKGASPST